MTFEEAIEQVIRVGIHDRSWHVDAMTVSDYVKVIVEDLLEPDEDDSGDSYFLKLLKEYTEQVQREKAEAWHKYDD